MQIQWDEKFHALLKTHFATFFKQYTKYTKKNMTLLNPCKLLMKFNQQKARTNVDIFVQKILLNKETTSTSVGLLQYSPQSRCLNTEIIGKQKMTLYRAWMNGLEPFSSFTRKLLIN